MIEDYDNSQLELFNGLEGGFPKRPSGNRFFSLLRRHEKKFLIVIGITFSCMISFSLGVKRGRKLSVLKSSVSFDLAEKKIEINENPVLSRQQKQPVMTDNDAQSYTVQLASYKAKRFADREAEALKKRGLMPLVFYKGGYVILCAGRFSDKEEAKSSVSKLKKEYKDCYLRRL